MALPITQQARGNASTSAWSATRPRAPNISRFTKTVKNRRCDSVGSSRPSTQGTLNAMKVVLRFRPNAAPTAPTAAAAASHNLQERLSDKTEGTHEDHEKQKTTRASTKLRDLFLGAGNGHVKVLDDACCPMSCREELHHPIAEAKRPRPPTALRKQLRDEGRRTATFETRPFSTLPVKLPKLYVFPINRETPKLLNAEI